MKNSIFGFVNFEPGVQERNWDLRHTACIRSRNTSRSRSLGVAMVFSPLVFYKFHLIYTFKNFFIF